MALYRQKPITRHFVELCRNYWEFSISMWNMASSDLLLFMFKIETTTRGTNFMPFLVFRWDHLRSTSGIICFSGSFAVQFGDHFRSREHLRSGIICRAVQTSLAFYDLPRPRLCKNVQPQLRN